MRRVVPAFVLALAGCSPAQNTALAMHPPISPFTVLLVADGVSVINTEKTVEDHVISLISGKDCSLVRASMGYDYCRDRTSPPTIQRISYCYKTLAAVSCYDHAIDSDISRLWGIRVDLVPTTPQ
jgi:hypothetical protein